MCSQPVMAKDFRFEMRLFLPNQMVKDTVESDDFWVYLCSLMQTYTDQVAQVLNGQPSPHVFTL